jgi:hypothetical protein
VGVSPELTVCQGTGFSLRPTGKAAARHGEREDYGNNLMLCSAVERQFKVLGEALRRLTILNLVAA